MSSLNDATIENLWQNFASHVLPKDVSETQRRETRNAFFAGFIDCLHQFMKIGEDDTISEDVGSDWLAARWAEGRAFIDACASASDKPHERN